MAVPDGIKRLPLAAVLVGLACASTPSPAAPPPTAAEVTPPAQAATRPAYEGAQCRVDFDEVRRIVEQSYAGYADKQQRLGSNDLDAATATAEQATTDATSEDDCDEAIAAWLQVFEDGHLSVVPTRGQTPNSSREPTTPREPAFTLVASAALVLRIPSFAEPAPIAALLEGHRAELSKTPLLIIDLRGNGGGSDAAYTPLIDYVYTGAYRVVGTDVLVTPDNISAWERAIDQLPEGMEETKEAIGEIVTRMREHDGRFMSVAADRAVKRKRMLRRPKRVVVFHDGACASSCEQFLLAARNSDKVTTFGQPTAGVLDYANVRSSVLPSTKRALAWATTRSRRLPDEPVDGIGIPPDVEIPKQDLATLDASALVRAVAQADDS